MDTTGKKPIRTRILIYHGESDISDLIELKNGKSNPFGWSHYELWVPREHGPIGYFKIGYLECGVPHLEAGYTYEEVDEYE